MPIEWDKIRRNPSKSHKILGTEVLDLKLKKESQEKNIAELTKNHDELKNILDNLESELKEKKENIASLENKNKDLNDSLANQKEKISELEKKVTDKTNEVEGLEKESSDKDNKISELENQIKDQTSEISTLKDKSSGSESEISDLKDKISQLDNNVSELEKLKSENESKIKNLEDQLAQVDTLKNEVSAKDEKINDLNTKIEAANTESEELNNKITELNNKIEELKVQIPKKPVYEKAEETLKGGPCPKCGFPIYEEYKIVEGEKQLIRKYCPNTICGWRSAERPKIKIMMRSEMPEEEKLELKIYQVKREGLEETDAINTKMVAIISDPGQNIIWIWKGKDSSRFEYADATNEATKIKREKLFQAHIERVDEGEEPENFPISIS
ncbi:MAG: hypothetical protein HWN67_10230 [Candidatus Helarchaeota archaeon]|nr:hypothetical protein [Candidatus Helarchaeota archaeon]